MERNIVDEYKLLLINTYKHEYDNNPSKREERSRLLTLNYSDEYLMKIIKGTYEFSKLIIGYFKSEETEYIQVPLEFEPEINYIDLNLLGGFKSDTIVHDSNNNLYSVSLINKIFENSLLIEPCRVEYYDEITDYKDYSILSEKEKYYLYVQKKSKKLKYDKEKIKVKQ